MTIQLLTVSITTDAGGDFTITAPSGGGLVKQVRYVVDGSSPLDTGADLTITDTKTGANILTMVNIGTSSFTRLPREFVANPADGVVSSTNVAEIPIHNEITVTVAQGGNTKLGTVHIWVEE
jgi:hypothetical protein